ncbi:MAG: hypothetical protein QN152_06320 [Armatimonadota bacterium]|nr:hypothetical protein [Armatimonadota bacterium]MDR7464156.1 hypothetical protein [Armatimonadota bacterium]MDR7470363.1 hypothetical protein [Armatimonadota bacterium]MDR7474090.1 hypothetical protein [Armatimonadota bacterium]MDR7539135.1 hypothetical protein [Armatimonadota bacterium]
MSTLQSALSRRVTLVVADSGYGKTTLLAQLADLPLAEWCFLARDTYRERLVEAATRYGEQRLAQKQLTPGRRSSVPWRPIHSRNPQSRR